MFAHVKQFPNYSACDCCIVPACIDHYITLRLSFITGNFGTSVASFFTFLRWLCALNLILTFLVIFFLLLPQLVVGHGLEVPDSIKGNVSAVSFIIDGKVLKLPME